MSDFEKPADLMLLWTHELLRVFYDRLVDADDRLWFLEQMKVPRLQYSLSNLP